MGELKPVAGAVRPTGSRFGRAPRSAAPPESVAARGMPAAARLALLALSFACVLAGCTGRRGESEGSGAAAADSTSTLAGGLGAASSLPSVETPEFLSEANLAAVPEPKLTPEQLAALAPPALLLRDLGFQVPHLAPDTTGRKNKAKLQREWVEALQDYEAGHYPRAQDHLQRAREFHAEVTEPDGYWPERIRNLDAAILYAVGPPGAARAAHGEIAEPQGQRVLDVGYQWVLGHDALRLGRAREAVARFRLVQQSPLKVNLEARKILAQLLPDSTAARPPKSL